MARWIKVRDYNWRKLTLVSVIVILTVLAYTWRLGTIVPGLGREEINASASSKSVTAIRENPTFAPQKLLQNASRKFSNNSTGSNNFALRFPSAIIAFTIIISFYYIARRWFGVTTSLMATSIVATTPWVLTLGRNASPAIMFGWAIVPAACYFYMTKSDKQFPVLLLAIVVALGLYVPGMIWILILLLTIWRKSFLASIREFSIGWRIASFIVMLILLLPLLIKLPNDFPLVRSWLAIPSHLPSPIEFLKSLFWGIAAMIWRTPYQLTWTLGRLPLLDIIQTVLVAFGAYAMYSIARSKLWLISTIAGFSILLYAISQDEAALTLGLLPLFILIAAGLRYLYFEWRKVFPLNPIPKTLALTLISIIVVMHLIYGLTYSLVAWPHNSITKENYSGIISR